MFTEKAAPEKISLAVRATVIVPAYNAEKSLEKSVKSALMQTERDMEIIIVDDCSTDSTWQVACNLAVLDSRIRLLQMNVNGGKSRAVNYATLHAHGAWIAVLDADDWYAGARLKYLIDVAESAQVDMVADNQIFVDINANMQTRTAFARTGKDITLDLNRFLSGSSSMSDFDYGMLKPIFRTSFLREKNIEYYAPARRGQDFYVLLDFFLAGGKALVTRKTLYYYVQPYGQVSGQWSQQGRKPYDFELLKQINDHYIATLKRKLSFSNMRKLEKRGRGFETMIHFHRIRGCMKSGDRAGAFANMMRAPLSLWPMVARRIILRLKAKLFSYSE